MRTAYVYVDNTAFLDTTDPTSITQPTLIGGNLYYISIDTFGRPYQGIGFNPITMGGWTSGDDGEEGNGEGGVYWYSLFASVSLWTFSADEITEPEIRQDTWFVEPGPLVFTYYDFYWLEIDLETTVATRNFSDGRRLETEFVDGVRYFATMTDLSDVYNWSSYTDSYNHDGDRISRSMTYDDGRVAETDYTDGVRASVLITDMGDAFDWMMIHQVFDAAGQLTSRTNTYDDGRVLEIAFIDGVKSSATMTDVSDVFVWTSYTDSFNDDGSRIGRSMTYDDGRVAETVYTDGHKASVLTSDAGDAYNWATINITFDASGNRTSRHTIFDDGHETFINYVDEFILT